MKIHGQHPGINDGLIGRLVFKYQVLTKKLLKLFFYIQQF
jgi:hypothetical protein